MSLSLKLFRMIAYVAPVPAPVLPKASPIETAKAVAAAMTAAGPPQPEAQQKPTEEDAAQTLDQQENMKISGSNARHMVMQKLMRKSEVSIFSI